MKLSVHESKRAFRGWRSYLVALSGLAIATAGRALARKVTGLAALVASSGAVVLGRLRAVTALGKMSVRVIEFSVRIGVLTHVTLA